MRKSGKGTSLWATVFGAAAALCLSACATGPKTLEEAVVSDDAIRVPLSASPDGLLIATVVLNDGSARPFLIDTGATRTVMFQSVVDELELEGLRHLRVHGMVGSEVRGTATLDSLSLAQETLEDLEVIVLPDRPYDAEDPLVADGILGMDVLGNYRLYVGPARDELVLLGLDQPAPVMPLNWARVDLEPNPFGRETKGLRFLHMRVNGRMAPALLDTGSDVSVMTYEFANWPEVRQARRRMKEQFELAGAVEVFNPRVEVRGVDMRAGSRVWYDEDIIIKSLDSLEVMGVAGQPFMIAGANLLDDGMFYLDFSENVLRLPKLADPDAATTGSRIGAHAANVTRIEPRVRSR